MLERKNGDGIKEALASNNSICPGRRRVNYLGLGTYSICFSLLLLVLRLFVDSEEAALHTIIIANQY